jgi:adenine-specific DNA-methyltransferase
MPSNVRAMQDMEQIRRLASASLDPAKRSQLGQFFTPAPVAALMARMFETLPDTVHLLDAGAGCGSLTAAFVAEVCRRSRRPRQVHATLFEIQASLAPHLRRSLAVCTSSCANAGIQFTASVRHEDFVACSVEALDAGLFSRRAIAFDAAILNPPYRKIGVDSLERRQLARLGLHATNLYAAFVALAIRSLTPTGEIVAILPRSFCNGPYFRPFREQLLAETVLRGAHVFESRQEAFGEDDVLQENVIIHARRAKDGQVRGAVTVAASRDAESAAVRRILPYEAVVRRTGTDVFIHLPTVESDQAIAEWMRAMPADLQSLGIAVSTGRVVDFRAREHLRLVPSNDTAPLLYPCHFAGPRVSWPKSGGRKPNAIVVSEETRPQLVARGVYVLTKRFSSKEESRRLVATICHPDDVPAPLLGFENHLNYFHRNGAGLTDDEALGLLAYLNSKPLDQYFRQFNGHTQVNATDLRSLRYPDAETLRAIGRRLKRSAFDQADYDAAVTAVHPTPSGDGTPAARAAATA